MQITQNPYFSNINYKNSHNKNKISFTSLEGKKLQAACDSYLKVLKLRPETSYTNEKFYEMLNIIALFKKDPTKLNSTELTPTKFTKTLLMLSDNFTKKEKYLKVREYPPDKEYFYDVDGLLRSYKKDKYFLDKEEYKTRIEEFTTSNLYNQILPKIEENPGLVFEALVSDALNEIENQVKYFSDKVTKVEKEDFDILSSILQSVRSLKKCLQSKEFNGNYPTTVLQINSLIGNIRKKQPTFYEI